MKEKCRPAFAGRHFYFLRKIYPRWARGMKVCLGDRAL